MLTNGYNKDNHVILNVYLKWDITSDGTFPPFKIALLFPQCLMIANNCINLTLVNVYVDLVVFTRIAGTS